MWRCATAAALVAAMALPCEAGRKPGTGTGGSRRTPTFEPVAPLSDPSLSAPGVAVKVFKGATELVAASSNAEADITAQVERVDFFRRVADIGVEPFDPFAVRYETMLRVTEDGLHDLVLRSDAVAQLRVNGDVVASTEEDIGKQTGRPRVATAATTVRLSPGLYSLTVEYQQAAGLHRGAQLLWQAPSFRPRFGTQSLIRTRVVPTSNLQQPQ